MEAYARQGRLKGAQLKKVAQDILKLALLKREPDRRQTEAIIAFASQEAHDSISGWVRQAAESFGVHLMVVPIPDGGVSLVQVGSRRGPASREMHPAG